MPILGRRISEVRPVRAGESVATLEYQRPRGELGDTRSIPSFPAALGTRDRMCGAPGCTSGWMKPWKNRRRPVFEDEWGCGTRCIEAMVSAAVRREFGDALSVEEDTPHRHRVPLGLVLLAQGWITHPQLQHALAEQRASGQGRIGEWLTTSCGLPEERIARGLGVQWNCPVLSLDGFSPREMALVMPKRFIAEFGIVPVRSAGDSILYIAFQDGMKAAAALSLEHMCGLRVESGLLTASMLEAARRKLLEANSIPSRMRLVGDADALTQAVVKSLEQRQPVASRLVRMNQYFWLRMWMEEGTLPTKGRMPVGTEDMEDHIFVMK